MKDEMTENIKKLVPDDGELPLMSYHGFVNKIRELLKMQGSEEKIK